MIGNTTMIDIKRAVSDSRKCTFTHYNDKSLWYKTEFHEAFPVPLDDVGDATFHAEEKALLLMRYMRKWNKTLQE
jgi:hypothetical protein